MNGIRKNFLLASLYQITYVLTPLLTTPYLTRVLGAEGIGAHSFAYSVAYYHTLFIRLGVMTYGNRAVAIVREDKKKLSRQFCEIYALQMSSGIIFTALYFIYSFLFAPRADLSICLLTFVLSSVVDITWLLYGVEDFTVTTVRDMTVRIMTVICILLFVKDVEDLWLYALLQGSGYLIGQASAWLRVRKHISFTKPKPKDVFRHLKPELILFVPSIAVSLYKILDKIMLGVMTNPVELGYYECSERVINLPMALITALGTVMFPRMSNIIAHEANDNQIRTVITKSLMLVTFISSILCFGIMSVSNQFVPVFYGKGYDKCIELFAWLLPSCVFLAFANVLRTQYLLPNNRDKQFIFSLFMGAGINLILNAVFIPLYMSVGAAMATLAAEAGVCIIQMIYTWRELEINKAIIKVIPFILSGIGMFLLFGNRIINVGGSIYSLFIKVMECGICYIVLLILIFGMCKLVYIINNTKGVNSL